MQPKGLKLAYMFAVSNAVIIGFSFLFTKIALGYAEPLDTLTYRFAASFMVISVPVAFGWVKLSYRGKPLYKLLLLATMYPLGFFTLQAFGLQHATSAEGGILYAFTPVVTLLLASLFLKERTTLPQKLSIFLSVFGVVFIFIMKESSFDLSNIMGISFTCHNTDDQLYFDPNRSFRNECVHQSGGHCLHRSRGSLSRRGSYHLSLDRIAAHYSRGYWHESFGTKEE